MMKYLFCVFLCLLSLQLFAQGSFRVSVSLGPNHLELLNRISYKSQLPDSISVYKEAGKIISQLQFKGFLLAEIKEFNFKENKVEVKIDPGKLYKLISLSAGNLPFEIKQKIGFKEKNYTNIDFNLTQLNDLFEKLLNYYENFGYPFANVTLDSLVIGGENISAKIKVQPFKKFTFDTIQIIGSAKISQHFLQTYLNTKKGAEYNEKSIIAIENRLRELPFINTVKLPEIEFVDDKAKINIYADHKNANQFDGILGLLPKDAGKIQLVGNLKLRLQNAFKRAELINFNYQGLPQKSQLLELKVNVPNILNTDFGINPALNLYKQDTSFLNVDTKLGFNYLFKGNNTLSFFLEHRSTSLIAVDGYKNITELPPILDANTTFYGLGFALEDLDYKYNPQKGYAFTIDLAVGNKVIKKNAAIGENLYQSINLNSTSYKIQSFIEYYFPLTKQLVFKINNETGILKGNSLLDNEIFRIGGQKSLRGFNELSIMASSYTYINVETRYLLEKNSFLFLFYNQAYINQHTPKIRYTDYPLGFGTGINLQTNVGILSISYALGKQKNNPINLWQGKIHFGIIALF